MYHNIEQNTDEWFALRAKKVTGSGFSKVMANLGKSFGDPAKKYAVDIAIEQITDKPVSNSYTNEHMQRGHEQEPLARMLYSEEYFCDVSNGGFFECGFVGVSPDGLVSDDGAIEIKSVIPSVHYANIKRQSFDPAYKWQLIGNLKYTEREWIDFISYCHDFPEDKKLYVYRIYRDDVAKEMQAMSERIVEFESLVQETKQSIIDKEYSLIARSAA